MSTQLTQAKRHLITLEVLGDIETSDTCLTHKERNAIALIRKRVVERLHEGFAGFAKDKDPDFDTNVPF